MSKREYEIGFGKPPVAYQFQKGQSGNPEGRKQKPLPTVARKIEDVLMETLSVTIGGIHRQSTGLELIATGLLVEVSTGNRKAHRVLRKYEAYAKTKPRIKKLGWTREEGAEAYGHYLKTGKWPKRAKKKLVKLAAEEKKRQKLLARMGRMRAGLEEPRILDGMTAREAGDMYQLLLKQSSQPKRPRFRPRKGKLEASEIFDQVINSPVTVNKNGHVMTSRMLMAIKRLFANAVRGDIKSADMLITMHAESLKYGDFFPETRSRWG